MAKTKLDETYIFKISIKIRFFWCSYWYQNSIFLSFGYYWAGSLLITVRYHELFDNELDAIVDFPFIFIIYNPSENPLIPYAAFTPLAYKLNECGEKVNAGLDW